VCHCTIYGSGPDVGNQGTHKLKKEIRIHLKLTKFHLLFSGIFCGADWQLFYSCSGQTIVPYSRFKLSKKTA